VARVLITDTDTVYRDRLDAALSRDGEAPGEQHDVLLLNPCAYNDSVDLSAARLVLLLVEESESQNLSDALAGYEKIQKYQRISDIKKLIEEKLDALPVKEADWHVVIAPSGGAGATTVAVALAMKFAKTHKRTLYLNMEALDSSPLFFSEGEGEEEIKQDKESRCYYIPQTSANREEIIHETNRFDVVVADVCCRWDKELEALLDKSESIVLVSDAGAASVFKLKQLVKRGGLDTERKHKTGIVYNKKPEYGALPNFDIPVRGNIGMIEAASFREIAERVSELLPH
jgi:2-phospho-L-lactate guanylyltransferase (CobY/MobA/RfbA family)